MGGVDPASAVGIPLNLGAKEPAPPASQLFSGAPGVGPVASAASVAVGIGPGGAPPGAAADPAFWDALGADPAAGFQQPAPPNATRLGTGGAPAQGTAALGAAAPGTATATDAAPAAMRPGAVSPGGAAFPAVATGAVPSPAPIPEVAAPIVAATPADPVAVTMLPGTAPFAGLGSPGFGDGLSPVPWVAPAATPPDADIPGAPATATALLGSAVTVMLPRTALAGGAALPDPAEEFQPPPFAQTTMPPGRAAMLPGAPATPGVPAAASGLTAPGLLAAPLALGRPESWAAGLFAPPTSLSEGAPLDVPDTAGPEAATGMTRETRAAVNAGAISGRRRPLDAAPGLPSRDDRIAPVLIPSLLGMQGSPRRVFSETGLDAANPLIQVALRAPPGRTVDPAAFEAALRLPGPLGSLLRHGTAPGAALIVQQAWELAVLGGPDPASGAPQPPIWARWGLATARQLDALVERLTGQMPGLAALAAAPDRPSRVGSLLLGAAATPLPQGTAAPGMPEAMLLGLGSDGIRPGLLGLVRHDEAQSLPAGAAALTVVASRPDSPLLLVHLNAPPAGSLPLGAGLTLLAAPAGVAGAPASATIAWAGPDQVADLAAPLLTQLAEAALDAVQRGGAPPSSVSVQVPLDGRPAYGTMRLATGERVPLGATPGEQLAWADAPPEARPSASLALGAGAEGDAALAFLGAHVTYDERCAVPLDIAPAVAAVPTWRLDDTQVRAAVGTDGVRAALARARLLHQRLLGGKLTLDQVAPGHGFATWEGSPAWLGLVGIRKPAGLGVLPGEADPPRAEVLRADDGSWLLERYGGCEGRKSRQGYAAEATDDLGFFEDALFGLPPGAAAAPPGGAAGAFAARGFRHARARMAAGSGDALARARAAEAWGLAARAWAGALERIARTGAGRLATRSAAPAQAGALREVAAWCGAVPAWHAAQAGGIDRTALLAAVDEAARFSLARALAPGAALACLLGEAGTGAPDPEGWPGPVRLLATGNRTALLDWGAQALAQAAEGRPETLGWSDALALAALLGRVAV